VKEVIDNSGFPPFLGKNRFSAPSREEHAGYSLSEKDSLRCSQEFEWRIFFVPLMSTNKKFSFLSFFLFSFVKVIEDIYPK